MEVSPEFSRKTPFFLESHLKRSRVRLLSQYDVYTYIEDHIDES